MLGPIGLASIAVGAFAVAYETNFLGIRDATDKTTATIVQDASMWGEAFVKVGQAIGSIRLPNLGQSLGIEPQIQSFNALADAIGHVSTSWNIFTGNARSLLEVSRIS
jgi:hypothetical protein